MSEKDLYEEQISFGKLGTWTIIILLSGAIVLYAIVMKLSIPNGPRSWDYQAVDSTPAASGYSTALPKTESVAPTETGKVPQQLETLPEARPLEKLEPKGYERREGADP